MLALGMLSEPVKEMQAVHATRDAVFRRDFALPAIEHGPWRCRTRQPREPRPAPLVACGLGTLASWSLSGVDIPELGAHEPPCYVAPFP